MSLIKHEGEGSTRSSSAAAGVAALQEMRRKERPLYRCGRPWSCAWSSRCLRANVEWVLVINGMCDGLMELRVRKRCQACRSQGMNRRVCVCIWFSARIRGAALLKHQNARGTSTGHVKVTRKQVEGREFL